MSLFVHPEGPPSEADLQVLVADLLFTGDLEEANRVASLMVSHWLDMPIEQRDRLTFQRQCSYWLGVRAATSALIGGQQSRAERRRLARRRAARTRRAA